METETSKQCPILSGEEIDRLEDFMIIHDLKICKTDIKRAAKELNIPVNSALMHFRYIEEELMKQGVEQNSCFLKKLRSIEKKINTLFDML